MPFFPQADILGILFELINGYKSINLFLLKAHNRTVLFVSHCGIHGVMEAIRYHVPIVGIPVFIDQKDNLVRLAQIGVAKVLTKESSAEKIYNVIQSALNSPQ